MTDRRALQSKKFLAFLTSNAGWLGLLGYGIAAGTGDVALIAMVLVAGAVQTVYIGGQAALDAYVRGASTIASGVGAPDGERR